MTYDFNYFNNFKFKEDSYVGIFNGENHCYMNTILQIFMQNVDLVEKIMNFEMKDEERIDLKDSIDLFNFIKEALLSMILGVKKNIKTDKIV